MESIEKQGRQDPWVLKGKVVSGAREAAFFTQLDWVQVQCQEKLGFKPYPGTLNLEIDEESLSVLDVLKREKGITLIPPDPQYCVARALPLMVGSICGAIIIPSEDVNIHRKNIVEVMAPVRLKDALGITDGDSLVLVIHRHPT
jgi:CTP-dependent riboflavin kinase